MYVYTMQIVNKTEQTKQAQKMPGKTNTQIPVFTIPH